MHLSSAVWIEAEIPMLELRAYIGALSYLGAGLQADGEHEGGAAAMQLARACHKRLDEITDLMRSQPRA